MAVADVDLTPTEAMARAAERGLRLREEHGRGGTEVGVARARDLKNRKTLSPATVRRMHSYFSRHAVDKKGKGWGKDSAGYIAWLLWGGDPGESWAARKVDELERAQGKSESSRGVLYSPMTVQRYDPDSPMSVREPTMFSKSSRDLLGFAAQPAIFSDDEDKDLRTAPNCGKIVRANKEKTRVSADVLKKAMAEQAYYEKKARRLRGKPNWFWHMAAAGETMNAINKYIRRVKPEGFKEIFARNPEGDTDDVKNILHKNTNDYDYGIDRITMGSGEKAYQPYFIDKRGPSVSSVKSGPFFDSVEKAKAWIKKAASGGGKPRKSKHGMDDACWPGHEAIGTKTKDGKRVPNCVPAK
jgi:hypothetical protein